MVMRTTLIQAASSLRCTLALALSLACSIAHAQEPVSTDAAEVSVREISERLYRAEPGERVDFSNRNLTYLDLSGLNFKGARLTQSDFYGVDFTGANLSRADLSKTRLDRATLIDVDLRFANLSGATLLRPAVYRDMSKNLADTPDFSGAQLVGTRIQANLSGARFRGANLTRSDISPYEKRPGEGLFVTLSYNEFTSCDFSGATLHNANLHRVNFTFSQFNGADFTGANIAETDFTKADLRGANLTNADVHLANFESANLAGIVGLETARNFEMALNLDKAVAIPPAAFKIWKAQESKRLKLPNLDN